MRKRQLPYFEAEMKESCYAEMESHNKPKSIAKDYGPSPFYFREQRGRDETRLVVWSPDLNQMKELFYQALKVFPAEVEVLLKIKREDKSTQKSTQEKWDRYYGQFHRAALEEVIKQSETIIFQDGDSQLNVRKPDASDYVTLDDHGVIYVYSKSEQFEKLCRENGFEERLEKLISDLGHWHITPKDAQKKRAKFIRGLNLKRVS